MNSLKNRPLSTKGFFYGLLLLATPLNYIIILPILFIATLLLSDSLSFPRHIPKYLLLSLYILSLFIFFLEFYRGINGQDLNLRLLIFPSFFLMASLCDFKKPFFDGLFISMILIFLINTLFNLYVYLNGSDLLDRVIDYRGDDFYPRLGGLYGHSFLNNAINVMGFLAGFYNKNKTLMWISILSFFSSASLREPICGILIIITYILIHYQFKKITKLFILLLFVIGVLVSTIWSTHVEQPNKSNIIRVIAWKNSIASISDNLIFGVADNLSLRDPYTLSSLSAKTFSDAEKTNLFRSESEYLELGYHFGVVPVILLALLIFNNIKTPLQNLSAFNRSKDLLAMIIFADTFYGSLLFTPFFCFFSFLFLYAYKEDG